MLGFDDPAELVGVNAARLSYPYDTPERAEEVGRLRRGEVGPGGLESQYRRKDGTPVWLRLRLAPIEGTTMFLCFFEDISDRKRIEEELLETAAELLEAQQLGRVGSWAWYPHENRTKRSRETARILGLSPEQWDSEDADLFNGVLHPDDAADTLRNEREAFASGSRHEDEFRILRDGEVRWVRSQGDVELDEHGRPYRLVGVLMDVTERRRAEEERRELEERLRQSQKLDALGQLAGGVAHDFNNLLMVIAGTSHLALSKTTEPAVRDDLLEVVQAAERAADLTKQLLIFSRRQPVAARHVDLNDVVTESRRMLERLIESSVEIHEELADDPLPVLADKGQLEQVLLNLALNARDAMPAGGNLTIRTRLAPSRTGRHGVISVEDTGAGIPDALLERIFEPFFTTKEPGRGTGLGLATVYGIVDAAGGEVSVSSRPGAGTVFTVSLPLDERSDDDLDEEDVDEAPAPGERVLLVDDDVHVRTTTARMLLSAGCGSVLEACDGREALELAESGVAFDLLVTDLIMPRMDGVELAARLREQRPGLPVLYVSGYTADLLGEEAAGPNSAYLPKPFSVSALRLSLAGLTT